MGNNNLEQGRAAIGHSQIKVDDGTESSGGRKRLLKRSKRANFKD